MYIPDHEYKHRPMQNDAAPSHPCHTPRLRHSQQSIPRTNVVHMISNGMITFGWRDPVHARKRSPVLLKLNDAMEFP